MKNIVSLILLLAVGLLQAQLPTEANFTYLSGNEGRSWSDAQVGPVYKDVPIIGSPYMDEIYKMGTAFVNGKEINLLMRYDAFRDQIEMIDKNQKSFNLLKKKGIEASFEGKTYQIMEYREGGEKKLGYVNPLNEGKVVLYLKPRKVFIQAESPENGYDDYEPPRYEEAHSYFIEREGHAPEEIRLAKRPLLRFLDDKLPELKRYVAENNLDLSSEKDAVRLLEYYNSLQVGAS